MLDNQTIVETKKFNVNSTDSIAIATAILLICDKLSDEFSEIVKSCIDEWLDSPLFASECLRHCLETTERNLDRYNAHSKVMLASKIHPVDSILHNWGKYAQPSKMLNQYQMI